MACCTNLGILDPCEPINTGYTATQNGVYKYVLTTSIMRIKGTLDVVSGAPLVVDCALNENAYYTLEIIAPDGTKLDCLEFTTLYTLNYINESD
jgi:hypothetical protein